MSTSPRTPSSMTSRTKSADPAFLPASAPEHLKPSQVKAKDYAQSPPSNDLSSASSAAASANSGSKAYDQQIWGSQGTSNNAQGLNPHSSTFSPSSTSSNMMPDLASLSLRDTASSRTPTDRLRFERFEAIKDKVLALATPRNTTVASNNATPATSSTCPPFTSRTSTSTATFDTPQTPHSPTLVFHDRRSATIEELQESPSKPSGSVRDKAKLGSEDDVGRYLMVSGIPKTVAADEVKALINSMVEFKVMVVEHLPNSGTVTVVFYDSREAAKLYNTLQSRAIGFRDMSPVYLNCFRAEKDMVEATLRRDENYALSCDTSESVVVVEIGGAQEMYLENVRNYLGQAGKLQRLQQVGHQAKSFIAEFYDTRSAKLAIETLNGGVVNGKHIAIRFSGSAGNAPIQPKIPARTGTGGAQYTLGSATYRPGIFVRSSAERAADLSRGSISRTASHDPFIEHHPLSSASPAFSPSFGRPTSDPVRPHVLASSAAPPWSNPARYGYYHPSQTPTHLAALNMGMDEPGASMNRAKVYPIPVRSMQDWKPRNPFQPNNKAIPLQNMVFPSKIQEGRDSRTTLMIKDVPNKLTRLAFVNALNEVVPGGFDFVYLRFDFDNRCNVGYAFVNFISLQSLLEFYYLRVGRRWNIFYSDKVLQVCYANIQGKEALIRKFTGSGVFSVEEEFHPQLFYSSGAMQGMPEPWPASVPFQQRERIGSRQYANMPTSYAYSRPQEEPYVYADSVFDDTYGF